MVNITYRDVLKGLVLRLGAFQKVLQTFDFILRFH